MRRSVGSALFLLLWCASTHGQLLLPCYAGFEVSRACITERGLDQKVGLYQRKITETMSKFGARYKIDLRVVNNPLEAGYQATVGDVFIEVVHNEEMRNDSTIPATAFTRRLAYTRASKFKGQNTRVVLKSLHSTDITDGYARVGGIGRGALPTTRQTRKRSGYEI